MRCFSKNIFLLVLAIFCSCNTLGRFSSGLDTSAVVGSAAGQSNTPDKKVIASDDFSNWQINWVVESENAYSIDFIPEDTILDIVAEKGLTLWYKKPFKENVLIRYEACVVNKGDSLDRVSDLNCFWMATDPEYPENIFARSNFRKGIFGRYYSLKLYYMGFGGNSNSTSRFRRYNGDYDSFISGNKRPEVITEYTDKSHLIMPNHWYSIEIIVHEGRVQYILDGEKLVDYVDPEPLMFGWFGIRTTENHIHVRNFRVGQN